MRCIHMMYKRGERKGKCECYKPNCIPSRGWWWLVKEEGLDANNSNVYCIRVSFYHRVYGLLLPSTLFVPF